MEEVHDLDLLRPYFATISKLASAIEAALYCYEFDSAEQVLATLNDQVILVTKEFVLRKKERTSDA